MLLTDLKAPRTSKYINQYASYAQVKGYPLEMREINPVHILEWTINEDIDSSKVGYKAFLYKSISKSKYPLSLFIKEEYIKILKKSKPFKPNLFEEVFYLFLNASKKYATSPRGAAILRNIPNIITDRTEYSAESRFLTNINESFKLSIVSEFYIWLANHESIDVMSSKPELMRAISDYKAFLQKTSTRGSYKKASTFFWMVIQLIEERPIDSAKISKKDENPIVINNFFEQPEPNVPLVGKQLPKLFFAECENKEEETQLDNNELPITYKYSPSTNYPTIDTTTWGSTAMNVIDKYILDKKSGIKILFGNEVVSKTKWTKVTPLHRKATLTRFFKRVIKVRLKEAPILGDFEIWSLNLDDIVKVVNEYLLSTDDLTVVRHFVAWMMQQPECPQKYQSTLENVYLQMPETSLRHPERQGRVWLNRKEYLIVILCSLESKGHLGLKRGIYVGLTGFCALRKTEAMLTRVGDFVLDDNLLLKNMNEGYGQLIVPRSIAKGESASIAPYHVAVVPRMRDLINEYLQSNFMEGYDENTFLMRTLPVFEDDEFFDHIKEVDLERGEIRKIAGVKGTDIMNAIADRSRMFLQCSNIKTPSTHDLRRTINQFILQCHLVHPLKAERAAEIHLRHKEDPTARNRTTNRTHYQETPTLAEYILCIDSTLNFPWDLDALEKWEKQNIHYTTIGVNDPEINGYPISDARQFSDTRLEENIKNDFIKPYGLKKNDRDKLELQMQIKHLSDLLKQPNTRNRINLQIKLTKLKNKLERMENDD